MEPKLALAGLAVGFLIGLTGVGSSSLLAPLLLFLGIPPITVVGSDLGYGMLTKLTGVGVHLRQGTVDWRWVQLLASGSVPGALVGSFLLSRLAASPGTVRQWIGVVLIATAILALLAEIARRRGAAWSARMQQPRPWAVSLLGLFIGLAVGLTSVGSGTLVSVVLMLFSPLAGAEMVGTISAHGVILSSVATGAHWSLGTIDTALVLNLLVGSLPGVLLGGRLAFRSPARPLKLGIAALVLLSGIIMAN